MSLQYLTDSNGARTAVLIPIIEWNQILSKHEDLKTMDTPSEESNPTLLVTSKLDIQSKKKATIKLSDLAGKLSNSTAEEMLQNLANSRNEWESRIENQ